MNLMDTKISQAARALLDSYADASLNAQHIDCHPLPSHAEIIRILDALQELLFPGYFGTQGLKGAPLRRHVATRMTWLHAMLTEQISRAICNGLDASPRHRSVGLEDYMGEALDMDAAERAAAFLVQLPHLRAVLASDVQAAYDGDPAAKSTDEIIFSYPGLYAVVVYRLAHELHKLKVPLIPRIMTEHAHHRTGIDIHPATRIGSPFFIDHGTGVVIGETAIIGNHVKLYQGVTLGAFSFAKDDAGNLIRNTKRHPTIGDDVVIYSGATILGGDTIIGAGSIIGGNVWLTHSVPPDSRVMVSQDGTSQKIITPKNANTLMSNN
ncbi:MAG: serine acetyltransferase [Pyrinomonadaceae bacterium]